MFSINYLAVIAAWIAFTVLGMLWYGPLFGKQWMKLAGFSESDMKTPEAKKSSSKGYVASLISSFVSMLALAILLEPLSSLATLLGSLDSLIDLPDLLGFLGVHLESPGSLINLLSFLVDHTAISGLIFGALLSFSFIAMTLVGEAAWHGKPAPLVLLNSTYRILGFAIAGLIINAWQ